MAQNSELTETQRACFALACQAALTAERETNVAGTQFEKALHLALKLYIEPDIANHEVRIGRHIADICRGDEIFEVQTRNLNTLRAKLDLLLQTHTVTVVYPVTATKWLAWINPKTKEITKRRKSPRRGEIKDIFRELYKIKMFLNHPNFRFLALFIDMEEHRALDGWSADGKKGSTRQNRIPLALADQMLFSCPKDYAKTIPFEPGEVFTSADYAKSMKMRRESASTALNILNHVGAVERVGKQGNSFLYTKPEL